MAKTPAAAVPGPAELLERLKLGLPVGGAGMIALQRSLGNQAIQRMLAGGPRRAVRRRGLPGAGDDQRGRQPMLQRHWLEGEEKVQASHDRELARTAPLEHGRPRRFDNPAYAQRRAAERAHLGRLLWRNPAGRIQRQDWKDGGAGVADAGTKDASWAQGGTPGVKGDAGTEAPEVKGDGGTGAPGAKAAGPAKGPAGAISAIAFAPAEIPADGKTTSQAKAVTSGAASVSKWSIVGDALGSSIDNGGVITPGTDTKGGEKVTLSVQATDDTSSASQTGLLTLWDAKLFQAKVDFPKFVGQTYTYENFTKGFNGKFDVAYNPAGNVANVNMKLKFAWPEEKAAVPDASNLWGLAPMLRHVGYQANFISQVMKQWSGRYTFENVREPKSIWGKLNPVAVKLNIEVVDAGQHFTVEVRDRAVNAAKGEQTAVGGGVLTLYQGDDVPHPAFNPSTAAGELTRVNRVTPTPILFGLASAEVPGPDRAKLVTMGQYISRINNPKFDIQIVGRASATGNSAKNQELSEKRAQAVADVLTGTGATNHNINASGTGDAGAAPTADWRKVDITNAIPAGWTNMQDTTAHEFGHMIGLGDEYASPGVPKSTHYDLVAKAFGPDYAEQVAKRGDADHASIMDGGDDVRIQHYVTFWSALVETTLKAPLPDPKFGYDDWKFVGT